MDSFRPDFSAAPPPLATLGACLWVAGPQHRTGPPWRSVTDQVGEQTDAPSAPRPDTCLPSICTVVCSIWSAWQDAGLTVTGALSEANEHRPRRDPRWGSPGVRLCSPEQCACKSGHPAAGRRPHDFTIGQHRRQRDTSAECSPSAKLVLTVRPTTVQVVTVTAFYRPGN